MTKTETRAVYRAEDDPPEPRKRTVLRDRHGTPWERIVSDVPDPWCSTRGSEHTSWTRLLTNFGPLTLVPNVIAPRVPADETTARHNDEPYQLVQHAEWRGGRLYLDGVAFPYATETVAQVKSALPMQESREAPNWHVVFVPVVVDGTLDLSGRPEPRTVAAVEDEHAQAFGEVH